GRTATSWPASVGASTLAGATALACTSLAVPVATGGDVPAAVVVDGARSSARVCNGPGRWTMTGDEETDVPSTSRSTGHSPATFDARRRMRYSPSTTWVPRCVGPD